MTGVVVTGNVLGGETATGDVVTGDVVTGDPASWTESASTDAGDAQAAASRAMAMAPIAMARKRMSFRPFNDRTLPLPVQVPSICGSNHDPEIAKASWVEERLGIRGFRSDDETLHRFS